MSPAKRASPSSAAQKAAASYFTAERIAEAWQQALALWGIEVNLSPPERYVSGKAEAWAGDEPLAYIDLVRRQVVVNLPLLHQIGAAASLPGVLAHEVGHHLKFPHTLGLSASLELLERKLIPSLPHSLTNLFFDLQVNEEVGRTRSAELAAVYRGFSARSGAAMSGLFHYYLAIYEELWSLPLGSLSSAEAAMAIEAKLPGYRADARMFAQTFYSLPDVYLQFVYFCSRFIRYLDPAEKNPPDLPLSRDLPSPDADDYAGAMSPGSAEQDAIEEAAQRGWIDTPTKSAAEASENGALEALQRALSRKPGMEQREFTEAIVSHVYRRLIDRHLIRLPETTLPSPDPYLPTIAEEWEAGDSPRSIDWTLSVLNRGALAALQPLRRELEADAPGGAPGSTMAVEIYLDTSGSMPDPRRAVNAMTLASQIVSAAALRRGGKVKAIIYSSQFEESPWLYNEDLARRFLLHYSGGGTDFPFKRLVELAEEESEVIRVVISDGDFLANLAAKGARELFAQGLDRSRMLVALLALPGVTADVARQVFGATAGHPHLRLGIVSNIASLPQAATQLTRALWGG